MMRSTATKQTSSSLLVTMVSAAATLSALVVDAQNSATLFPVDPSFGQEPPPIVDPVFEQEAPVDPGFEKEPPVDPEFGQTPPRPCSSEYDCFNGQFCAQGFCTPYGSCTIDVDCYNPTNVLLNDERCVGYLYCDDSDETGNFCRRQCGTACPDNKQPSNCEAVAGCDPMPSPATSCVLNTCDDQCSFIYFDDAGFVVEKDVDPGFGVTPPPTQIDPGFSVTPPPTQLDPGFGVDPPKECTSGSDCDESSGEYCGKGLCMPSGSCVDDFDCLNSANSFAAVMCAGYVFCNTSNQCDTDCSSQCPNGQPDTSNCAVSECDTKKQVPGAVSCTPAPCDDDCSGIYYDEQGFVIYDEDNVDPGFGLDPPKDCSSDSDCVSGTEYCGHGTCLPMGNCSDDIDCSNPANGPFADVLCVGYQYCDVETKKCARMCGEPCPGGGGEEATDCSVSACDTKIAVPGAVSCAPDLCDANCGGIYFDAAGYEVHKDAPAQTCMNGLCPVHEGAYCDENGNCLLVGLCTRDSDCFIPYNDPYPAAMCVGNIVCADGLCVNDCDPNLDQCSGDDAKTIVDVVCADPDLTTLCEYIESKPQIVTKLSAGDYTLFAPVDAAFSNLPTNWDTDLAFHVVGRSLPFQELNCKAGENLVGMISGKNTRTMCTGGSKIPTVQKGKGNERVSLFPQFVATDLQACNGLVHKISQIMLHEPEAEPYVWN